MRLVSFTLGCLGPRRAAKAKVFRKEPDELVALLTECREVFDVAPADVGYNRFLAVEDDI